MGDFANKPEDSFTHEYVLFVCKSCKHVSDLLARERREHRIFNLLIQMIPGLQERLMDASAEEVVHVGDLVSDSHRFLDLCCLTL